jgi:hypothetical protein
LECITMPHFEVGTTKGMQRAMQDAIIFRKWATKFDINPFHL